ncbi:MAG: hypothetical protein AB9869_17785 [Verrucomicrobiia bacterium]
MKPNKEWPSATLRPEVQTLIAAKIGHGDMHTPNIHTRVRNRLEAACLCLEPVTVRWSDVSSNGDWAVCWLLIGGKEHRLTKGKMLRRDAVYYQLL